MKKLLCFLPFLLVVFSAKTQEWVEMKYNFTSQLNIDYGSSVNFLGKLDTLKLDVYQPTCNDASVVNSKPLLLWVHGGGFISGDKSEANITNLCKEFAQRGYVTASINYRLGFIADEQAWNCNFPNYSCVFATDSAEWYRAYYRAVQDGKGALRYLINRSAEFNIDPNNVFVAGESAGAFIALGISLLDTVLEKPIQAFSIADAPKPNINALNCTYNLNQIFNTNTILRPDLGSVDGTIEPSTIQYSIKGVGNMYGAMFSNLLLHHPLNKPKPAIYSFHQPCDLVVPIDSNKIFSNLSWCMTNGYNCFGINFTPKVYGSRTISQWNNTNNYGFTIQNEFTNTNFPFNFLFGNGSCVDQVNNPCHAYDNRLLRANNMAQFFAPLISTNPICDSSLAISPLKDFSKYSITIYPNPSHDFIEITTSHFQPIGYNIHSIHGKLMIENSILTNSSILINTESFPAGVYIVECYDNKGRSARSKFIKN